MSSAASSHPHVADELKYAMRHMPSPVALVSTRHKNTHEPYGIAVTAYNPVSMAPPSMQICINRNASAYETIIDSGAFCINVLGMACAEQLQIFSDPSRKDERFSGESWQVLRDIPYLVGARSAIFCKISALHDFGTHSLIIGLVEDVLSNINSTPAVWLEGKMKAIVS